MKNFMAVFLGTDKAMSDWHKLPEAERREREQKGMKAWGDWMARNQTSVVYAGSPLGKTKKVNRDGVSDTKNALAAFTVVSAESHEAAAKMFLEHPHFMLFPGDSVEVMECLPIPSK